MTLKKSDDAVSPVIGVMLMLVITVVIAAVVTIFATGVVSDTEPAPTAVFDVKILTEYTDVSTGPDFQITHLAGDEIDTKYIEIRTSWTDQNGKYHYSTYSADKFKAEGYKNNPTTCYSLPQLLYIESEEYIDVRGEYRTSNAVSGLNHYFGDVVLKPGFKLKAGVEFVLRDGSGKNYIGNPHMDAIFNNGEVLINSDPRTEKGIMEYLPEGTAVDVTILHIPSNKVIFNKVVFVE